MFANTISLLYSAVIAFGGIVPFKIANGRTLVDANHMRSCSSVFSYQIRPSDSYRFGLLNIDRPLASMLPDGTIDLKVLMQVDGIVPEVNICGVIIRYERFFQLNFNE